MTQAEQLAAQAAQWQAAGRPDMAVQLYTAALDQDPSKFAIRMQLAECLAYLQQPEPAAEHYLMVAQAYAARGHPQECLAICERVINIAPQSFVYMSVGPMIRRIGRQARPLCAKAAELHLGAGRQTDGLQMLRLGAELDPHNPEVRMQLARIYQARHMKREAVEALSDAGNLLLQAKRYQDYVGVASQVLALEPRDLNTLRDMPRVYLELGRPHDAVRALGQLTKASPGDIVGYEILAQAFAVIGRSDKSLAVLERLVEELGATGQADKADAILNHARYWRPTDLGFLRSLKRVEIPRPRTIPPVDPPPPAPEGTVVLSIADLVMEESRRAPVPGREDSSVRLIEAEGTLTLDLDELLVDEMEQVMLRSSTPSRPPPPPPKSRPGPKLDVNATITLDGAALMEALVELEGGKDDDDGHDEDATTVPPGTPAAEEPEATRALSPLDPSLLPKPSPPASSRAITRPEMPAVADGPPPPAKAAISELIYDDDDDDDDGEPATMLHMRALTPEEIARAQQAVAQAAAERAQARAEAEDTVDQDATTIAPPGAAALPRVDLDAPTIAPPGAAALPRVDLDAPTIAPPVAAPPSRARPPLIDDLEGPTLGPAHGSMDDIDAPTLGPMGPDTTFGGGEEAPTMARLTPLSAADIARALAKGQPRATAPVPEPPSPPMPVAPPQWSAPPPPASTPGAGAEPPQWAPPPLGPVAADEPPSWSAPVPPPSVASAEPPQWAAPMPPPSVASAESPQWAAPMPPPSVPKPDDGPPPWAAPTPPPPIATDGPPQWAAPVPPPSVPQPEDEPAPQWSAPTPPPARLDDEDDFDEDEVTPLPGPLPRPPASPEQPPLLAPDAQAVPNDEEQMTMVQMHALSPADIERALRAKRSEDES